LLHIQQPIHPAEDLKTIDMKETVQMNAFEEKKSAALGANSQLHADAAGNDLVQASWDKAGGLMKEERPHG
jgi:hypothetical protein